MSLEITPDEAYTLLMSSVRYALGRQSYVVGQTCDIVRKLAGSLTPAMLEVLIRDIQEHDDRCRATDTWSSPYGSKWDEVTWKDLKAFLETEVATRIKGGN